MAALAAVGDPLLLVLAADHLVGDELAFASAINNAIPLPEEGKLVTFGVVATSPHEGYGYIKRGAEKSSGYAVEEFVEKPSLTMVKEYYSSGKYYWNSGIFLFKASRYLAELGKFSPEILRACKYAAEGFQPDLVFLRMNADEFYKCPSDSIDYAVWKRLLMLSLFLWMLVGAILALGRLFGMWLRKTKIKTSSAEILCFTR